MIFRDIQSEDWWGGGGGSEVISFYWLIELAHSLMYFMCVVARAENLMTVASGISLGTRTVNQETTTSVYGRCFFPPNAYQRKE